ERPPRGRMPRGERATLLYCSGEKAEGRGILFSCVMSRSAPPGGGHTPFFLASSRTCIRLSMLEYAQMCTKPLARPNSTPPANTIGESFARSAILDSQPFAVSGRVPGLIV